MRHNYTMDVKVYTVEEYLEETGWTLEEMREMHGTYVRGFVWALMHDESVNYYWRVFAPIYGDTWAEHMAAVNTATLHLMQEYEEYIKKAENK